MCRMMSLGKMKVGIERPMLLNKGDWSRNKNG